MALLSEDAPGLHTLLDLLREFSISNGLRVNVSKTEIVVFGPSKWRPPSRHEPWRYAGAEVPVSPSFKYLGIELHSTRGVRAATARLRASGLRAIWGMHSRCKSHGIEDFSLRTRLFRTLAEPILTYGSEVWGPDLVPDMESALKQPLQVLQNDYIRRLGGLRRCTPPSTLSAESCLQPLPRAWLRAASSLWDRMLALESGIMKEAFLADMHLALNLPPAKAVQTWSGAWLRALRWLAAGFGPHTSQLRQYLTGLGHTMARGSAALTGLRVPVLSRAASAWDEAFRSHTQAAAAANPTGARAAYLSSFADTPTDRERGFPPQMPYYFRHTSHFHRHTHAQALMRLRCCSTPFAACPSNHAQGPRACTRCDTQREETAEHVLLDCPAYAALRSKPDFAPLFEVAMQAQARMRAFASQPGQHALAAFVFECFEARARPLEGT